jgi:hypothetical protein
MNAAIKPCANYHKNSQTDGRLLQDSGRICLKNSMLGSMDAKWPNMLPKNPEREAEGPSMEMVYALA